MLLGTERVNIPQYCGLPRLSHQFPVAKVVTETAAVVTVDVLVEEAVVDIFVLVLIDVAEVVEVDVVDEAQDAKTSDVTIRKVSTIQIIPLFIQNSFLFEKFSEIN